jgi:hypothetical protein
MTWSDSTQLLGSVQRSHSDEFVAEIDHYSQPPADRVRVPAQNLDAHHVSPLDLRYAPNADAHGRSHVTLGQTSAPSDQSSPR